MADWVRARQYDLWLLPAAEPKTQPVSGDDHPPHAAWLGVPWQRDAEETLAVVAEASARWLVVDHYALDSRWERSVAAKVGNLMVIDDLADRDHHCDFLLDQNPGRLVADYADRAPQGCVCLTGTRYALLRDEFRQWRERHPPENRTGGIRRILVTLGGADPDNVTGQVLSSLSQCQLASDVHVDVLMGHSSPHLATVRAQAHELPFQATVTAGATNMAERMVLADLAIGAAGATTWERCCMGLPSLIIAIAANQRTFLRTVAKQGLSAVTDLSDLPAAVRAFVGTMQAEPSQYFAMVAHASEAVDGLGASRVADYMVTGQEVEA